MLEEDYDYDEEGEIIDENHVQFLDCNFECTNTQGFSAGDKVLVEIDFKDIILQDNEEDGNLSGDVKFILYKGDHYHLTVTSECGEDIYVDTNDVWDNGDCVGITIDPGSIRLKKL